MKKISGILAFLSGLSIMLTAAEPAKIISIDTDNSQILLSVKANGELDFLHYGSPVTNPEELSLYRSYRRDSYGTDPLAYPTAGGKYFNHPALSVKYADGRINTELVYRSHVSYAEPGATVTELLLRDEVTELEVKLVYRAFREEDVIAIHSEITNGGKKPVTLVEFASAAVNLEAQKYLLTHMHGSWAGEMMVDRELLTHGTKIIDNQMMVRTTHNENPSFMLSLDTEDFSENHGPVIAGALAWSGNFRLQFQMDETDKLQILSGINPDRSNFTLARGASLTTPEMIYTFSANGAGQASRNLHDWARNYHLHSAGVFCPTLLNSWEGAYFTFDEQVLKKMIDDTASMGLEMFVLDDGWFGNKYQRNDSNAGLGDWDVNREKLPKGIHDIASYAHSKGLKFGIWIEPEMANEKSEIVEQHPDWVVGDKSRNNPLQRSQWILDLSNPAVQDFVFGVFDRTIALSPDIDYIKWDANRHIDNAGSDYQKDQNNLMTEYAQGFYKVMERIRAKYPDVLVQCCSSGGGRVEYGELKYFDEVWGSDCTEALTRLYIQYGTSLIYPSCVIGSHVSDVPNHQTKNITPLKFRFDVASAYRLGMELQPKTLNDSDKEFSRNAIENYKSFRDIIEKGDLYRLLGPYDSDQTALMYVSKDKKRAVVFVYTLRWQTRTRKSKVLLDGLDPSMSYKVSELNRELSDIKSGKYSWWGAEHSFHGDFLMNFGINPNLPTLYASAVYLLEAE